MKDVVDAMIRADKGFNTIEFPGAGDGVGLGHLGICRTQDFFVRHLHGVQPRSE